VLKLHSFFGWWKFLVVQPFSCILEDIRTCDPNLIFYSPSIFISVCPHILFSYDPSFSEPNFVSTEKMQKWKQEKGNHARAWPSDPDIIDMQNLHVILFIPVQALHASNLYTTTSKYAHALHTKKYQMFMGDNNINGTYIFMCYTFYKI
jgi:hypothetical protein